MVTHGFNIKLAFGTAVDEGYCMVLKPEDAELSLAESIGSLPVADKEFQFDYDSFPVNAIARMSPESANHMQSCNDVRSAQIRDTSKNEADILAALDDNADMRITKEEFVSSLNLDLGNSAEDAFDFIRSVLIQPHFLGKSNQELETPPAIELGQFFHINWGWREYASTNGNIAYPWRAIIENTIGSGGETPEQRVALFKQKNAILTNLIKELKNDQQNNYPTKEEMERKLVNCESLGKRETQFLFDCAAKVIHGESGGPSYIPMGPGDNGAAAVSDGSVFGAPLAYPSEWKPNENFYESRSLKVAYCLVSQGSLSLSELSDQMGCNTDADIEALLLISSANDDSSSDKNSQDALVIVFGSLFAIVSFVLVIILFVTCSARRRNSQDTKTNNTEIKDDKFVVNIQDKA
jgi:hypothetical protein